MPFPFLLLRINYNRETIAALDSLQQHSQCHLYSLPDELLLLLIRHLISSSPPSSPHHATQLLLPLTLTSRLLNELTTPYLYTAVHLSSLPQLDSFLSTLEHPHGSNKWGALVRSISVQGRVFAKGYGVRVARLLKAATEVERVEVVSADDLRMKHFVGTGSASFLLSLSLYALLILRFPQPQLT